LVVYLKDRFPLNKLIMGV